MPAPIITYPNSTVAPQQTLASLAVGAVATTVAVPKNDTPATLEFTLTATSDSGSSGDMNNSVTDVEWKLVSTNDAAAEAASVTGVTLTAGENGRTAELSVTKAAAAALASNSNTYYVVAYKGDVKSTPQAITITKETSAATTVTIAPKDGAAYTEDTTLNAVIPSTDTPNTYVFTAEVYDQYGAVMATDPTWTLSSYSNVTGAASGTNNKTYTVSVAKATTEAEGAFTLKAGANGHDSVVVTFDAIAAIPAKVSLKSTPDPIELDYADTVGGSHTTIGAALTDADELADAYIDTVTVTGTAGSPVDASGHGAWSIVNGTTALTWGANTVKLRFTPETDLHEQTGFASDAPYTYGEQDVTVYVKKTLDAGDLTLDAAKLYDGKKDMPAGAAFTIDAAKTGDHTGVEVDEITAAFADADAGADKDITVTKLTFKGDDVAEFYFAEGTTTGKAKGDIDKAADLTLTVKTGDNSARLTSWTLDDVASATGLVNSETLNTVFGALTADENDPAVYKDAKGIVTLTFYEKKVTPAVEDDPNTDEDESADEVVEYIKTAAALTTGKDYYVDIAVTADTDKLTNYETAEKLTAGAPTDPITADKYTHITFTRTPSYVPSGPTTAEYTVTYQAGEHGAFADGKTTLTEKVEQDASPASVPAVTAKEGYVFAGWTMGGKTYTAAEVAAYQVTGNVTFTAAYKGDINFAPGYIRGYSDGSFRPGNNLTRAEAMGILSRLSKGFEEDGAYTGSFTDVKADDWFAPYVNYFAQKGIVKGYVDGSFQPNGNITRAEFAAAVVGYLGLEPSEHASAYADVNGHWAESCIVALNEAGLINGYPDGSFQPNARITRAEAVKLVNAAVGLKAAAGDVLYQPNDVSDSHWAYSDILAAINCKLEAYAK